MRKCYSETQSIIWWWKINLIVHCEKPCCLYTGEGNNSQQHCVNWTESRFGRLNNRCLSVHRAKNKGLFGVRKSLILDAQQCGWVWNTQYYSELQLGSNTDLISFLTQEEWDPWSSLWGLLIVEGVGEKIHKEAFQIFGKCLGNLTSFLLVPFSVGSPVCLCVFLWENCKGFICLCNLPLIWQGQSLSFHFLNSDSYKKIYIFFFFLVNTNHHFSFSRNFAILLSLSAHQ